MTNINGQTSRIILLLGGNGLGQLLTIAATPVLAHLYSPADFGLLASIVSTVSLSAVIVHGRYHMAIAVSQDDDEAIALFTLATLLSIVLSPGVVLLISYLAGRSAGDADFPQFVMIATTLTMLVASIDVFAYWRSRQLRFKASAQNAIVRAGVTAAAQIGFSPANSIGLVGGTIAGAVTALALSIRDVARFDAEYLTWPSWGRIIAAAKYHAGYPLFGMPQGLIAAISWNAFPLLLLNFSGDEVAGQYWMAYRLLVAPIGLFNAAYRQATLPTMGLGDRSGAIRIARQHSIVLLLAAAIAAAIVFFFGETLFAVLFGEKWKQAGAIAAWLGIGLTADVAKIPAMCLLQSRANHRSILVWEAVIAIARYSGALIYLSRGDVIVAVAIFSLVGFMGWVSFAAYHLIGTAEHEIGEARLES